MNEKMKRRIKNAERTDHLMTGVFCAVGGSFLLLILVLAGYIIIKGIMSYFPGFWRQIPAESETSCSIPSIWLCFLF